MFFGTWNICPVSSRWVLDRESVGNYQTSQTMSHRKSVTNDVTSMASKPNPEMSSEGDWQGILELAPERLLLSHHEKVDEP